MAIKNTEALEKFLELEEGQKLSDLISSEEEVELKFKEGDFYTKEQDAERIGNYKTEFSTAGREILLKELRDENKLEFDGVKDPKNFVAALTAKVKASTLEEAKIEPDKKITELETDLGKLRSQLTEKDDTIIGLKKKSVDITNSSKIDKAIAESLPDSTTVEKEDLVILFKSKNDIRINDKGVIEMFKNGEVMKNDLRNPVELKKVASEFGAGFIKKAEGGSGDTGGGNKGGEGSMDAFIEEMKDKNIPISGEAFNIEMSARITAGTLKL